MEEATTYVTWLDRLYDRLESETQPDLLDGVQVPPNDPRGQFISVACELQDILGTTRYEILYREMYGFTLDMLIRQNGVAASLLYAAPRPPLRIKEDERLIQKLHCYATGAKIQRFLDKMAYIDALWMSAPGMMKKTIADISGKGKNNDVITAYNNKK